jgi:hypothetical protein
MKTIYLTYIAAVLGMLIFYTRKFIGRNNAEKFNLKKWLNENTGSMVLSVLSTIGLMLMFNFELITLQWDKLSEGLPVLKVLNAPVVFGMLAGYYGTVLFKLILKNMFQNVTKK